MYEVITISVCAIASEMVITISVCHCHYRLTSLLISHFPPYFSRAPLSYFFLAACISLPLYISFPPSCCPTLHKQVLFSCHCITSSSAQVHGKLNSYVWRYVCAVDRSYVWRYVCAVDRSYVWRYVCAVDRSYVWRYVCAVDRSYVWYDIKSNPIWTFVWFQSNPIWTRHVTHNAMCVPWIVHMCDMAWSYGWHALFIWDCFGE